MHVKSRRIAWVISAGILAGALFAATAQADAAQSELLQQAWRTAIARTPLPAEGCFTASYPVAVWRQVKCHKAPNVPYLPRGAAGATVGNFNDYAAVSRKLITSAKGSFPVVQNLVSETGAFGPSDYSLQVNSNFMPGSRACAAAAVPASCAAWQQFVYGSSDHMAFMQYWLIDYDTTCPANWNTMVFSIHTDCWINGQSVFVGFGTAIPITDLPKMSLTGSAQKGGLDALTLVDGTQSWGTSGKDRFLFLASGWRATDSTSSEAATARKPFSMRGPVLSSGSI